MKRLIDWWWGLGEDSRYALTWILLFTAAAAFCLFTVAVEAVL